MTSFLRRETFIRSDPQFNLCMIEKYEIWLSTTTNQVRTTDLINGDECKKRLRYFEYWICNIVNILLSTGRIRSFHMKKGGTLKELSFDCEISSSRKFLVNLIKNPLFYKYGDLFLRVWRTLKTVCHERGQVS